MLKQIHSSHLGIEKCKRRARDVLFWPGMGAQIEDIVTSCMICSTYQRNNTKEPLLSHSAPSRPWKKVGADLCEFSGRHFLILVDYYSNFIEVDCLRDINSDQIIKMLVKPNLHDMEYLTSSFQTMALSSPVKNLKNFTGITNFLKKPAVTHNLMGKLKKRCQL